MIGGIILGIITSIIISLMIHNTANSVISDYRDRFGSEVFFTFDQRKAMIDRGNGEIDFLRPNLEAADFLRFSESEYLKETTFEAESRGSSESLRPIDAELGGGGGAVTGSVDGDDISQEQLGRQFFHKVLAHQFEEFQTGLRTLTEGSRFPINPNEIIISQVLLDNSNLKIGDTITLDSALELQSDSSYAQSASQSTEYIDINWELTIVGTFDDFTPEYEFMIQNAFFNRRNEILTNFETLEQKVQPGTLGIRVDATFYLKNPDLLEAFTNEVREKGLSEVYNVNTNEATYQLIVGPVEALRGITTGFAIVILILGAVILSLLLTISIGERKYEIGVLRAMGLKKIKVMSMLWTEILIITTLCLILGIGLGKVIAQPITNLLLEQQAEAISTHTNLEDIDFMDDAFWSGTADPHAEPLTNMTISIGSDTIGQIILAALILSTLSGLIATLKIVKYEPIKILQERG